MTGTIDREIVRLVCENPYMQAFCGLDNFYETGDVALQLENYEQHFGVKPLYMVGDRICGAHDNRNILKNKSIRDAFEPRGRKPKHEITPDRWLKRKRRECSRIERAIGNGKNHYGLEKNSFSADPD